MRLHQALFQVRWMKSKNHAVVEKPKVVLMGLIAEVVLCAMQCVTRKVVVSLHIGVGLLV